MDLDDRSRWLAVPGEGPDEPYRDMRHFITTVTDTRLAQRLTDAIDGRGAFRRFYKVIATAPDAHPMAAIQRRLTPRTRPQLARRTRIPTRHR